MALNLTNVGRRLAPGLATVYDIFRGAQDAYNDMWHYDQYKTRERIQNDATNRIYQKINNINEDTSRRNEDYAYYNDLVQKGLANDYEKAYRDEAYNAILNNKQAANELYGKLPANNYELFNMVASAPTTNPITNIDKQASIDSLIARQIGIMKEESDILDGYRQDKNYTNSRHAQFLRDTEDERERNQKTLKALGVSPDQVRGEYYKLYPTPQMLGAQALAKNINDWMYGHIPQIGTIESPNVNLSGPGIDLTVHGKQDGFYNAGENNTETLKQQAKRLITNELGRMRDAGEIQTNPTRTQKLIDLYNKLK